MKWVMLIIIILTAVLPGNAFSRTYTIGMIHWIAYSPLNVAEVKGFWKDSGIEVKVINFGSIPELNAALEQKQIDIAIEMIGSWVGMYLDGLPITILGETNWSHGGDKIISKKDFAIGKQKNQTVGVYLNQPSVTFFLSRYLEENNVNISTVKIVEMETKAMSDDFIAGRLNTIVSYDPEALRAEKEGNGQLAATSASYPGCIPEGFAARTDVLKDIPQNDLIKIFKGWTRAVTWIGDEKNWKEFVDILNAKTFEGENPYSDKDIKEMLNSVKIHDPKIQLERNKDRGGLHTYLKDLRAFLADCRLLKKNFKPKQIFDNKALVKSLTE